MNKCKKRELRPSLYTWKYFSNKHLISTYMMTRYFWHLFYTILTRVRHVLFLLGYLWVRGDGVFFISCLAISVIISFLILAGTWDRWYLLFYLLSQLRLNLFHFLIFLWVCIWVLWGLICRLGFQLFVFGLAHFCCILIVHIGFLDFWDYYIFPICFAYK